MSAFVTETLPEDLNVLLFSQSPVLADLFADQLNQHGLEVTQKSSDIASLTHFLESGLSSTWYKVFWIDDVNHLSIDQAKKMSKIFQEIKGLSYVVMHHPFTYRGIKQFEIIGQKIIDVSVFFEQRAPYTSILTYKDVLSNEFFSLNYQQIIHFLHQTRFPFTDDNLGFLNEKELIEGVISLSFDPRGGKRRVVVSKRPLLTKTVMKAVQSEFRRRFKGEEVLLQKELSLEWGSGFKEFAVPGSPTLDEVVSELIVEAKFHYQPEKSTEEPIPSDIPKPQIPKPKPVEDLQKLSQKEVPLESDQAHSLENSKEEEPLSSDEIFSKKRPTENSAKHTQPQEERVESKKPERVVRKIVAPILPTKNQVSTEFIESLPISQLVPSSLRQFPSSSTFSSSSKSIVRPMSHIQERSIQVHVETPLMTVPRRAPVLIPEQHVPEIRRSKIILHQFSSSLEKRVNKPSQQEHIPKINPQITARVHQEQQHEQERKVEHVREEDQQKKQLEKKIATLFSGTIKPQPTLSLRKKERITPIQVLFGRETRVGKWYRAQKGVFLLCLAISITTVSLVGLFFFSISSLQRNLVVMAQQFESGGGVEKKQIERLVFSQNLLEKQLSLYSAVVGTSFFSDAYSSVDVSKKLSTLSTALSDIQTRHIQTIRQVLGSVEGDPVSTLIPSLGNADTVYKQLSLLEGELKDAESSSFFQTQLSSQQQEDFIDSITEIRRSVLIGQQLTEVLPNLLGKESNKTLAIVLQDAQELRATGGFVQSVALVTLNGGRVSDIKIIKPDSLSSAVGEVAAPEEVAQYLGEKQWFLRDGNWNPNFDVTAKQIQFFLEKGLNTKIDGVIGLNTHSLAKIIGSMGSVTVKDFNDESITDKNFAERQFFYAKTSLANANQAQASSQPEFLESVFEATLEKLRKVDDTQTKVLMEILSEQLKQAEITASFHDLATETTFGSLGWTGTIINPPCPTQLAQDQCLVSRIYQVDSNVGVNKVNFSVKKKVDHSIQIKPEQIIHQRSVTYENSSSTNSWPGGVYKNYIRWYLPDNVKLRIVTINGKEVDPTLIKQYQDKSSKVIGVLVEVLSETTTNVVLEYEEEPIGKQASYAFFDQKQPGTGATPTKITMFYDEQFIPIVIAPDAQVSGEKIEFSFWGGEHIFAGVKFR